MVQPTEKPDARLARRLRTLRKQTWPDCPLTQTQLARLLGVRSAALISSWENEQRPVTPPANHLETYALIFATERSIENNQFRVLNLTELTPTERSNRDLLLHELTSLRTEGTAEPRSDPGLWQFPANEDIMIVCAQLPYKNIPFSDPRDPDYAQLADFADIDALMELYGHLRATNPDNKVRFRTANELRPNDYTAHLVLLGGVDWNEATRDMFMRIGLPVGQQERSDDDDHGEFWVGEDDQRRSFKPTLVQAHDRWTLCEDVAFIYRGPSPYNQKRTVTSLNGMFGRGTYGAVRALTDRRFRDRNEAYIRERFAESDSFFVLSRVPIVNGRVVTPDWTLPEARLYEWPEVSKVGGATSQAGT